MSARERLGREAVLRYLNGDRRIVMLPPVVVGGAGSVPHEFTFDGAVFTLLDAPAATARGLVVYREVARP